MFYLLNYYFVNLPNCPDSGVRTLIGFLIFNHHQNSTWNYDQQTAWTASSVNQG